MTDKLVIALVQLNYTVGDLEGNRDKIIATHKQAAKKGANLVVFTEMAVTGYPPEDLILRPHFQDESMEIVRKLALETKSGPAMIIGCIWRGYIPTTSLN